MLQNYLKIALRNLRKNSTYSIINTIGIGVAVACCIVAYLNYSVNTSFDSDLPHRNRTFRILTIKNSAEGKIYHGKTPLPLLPTIQKEIPAIETSVRFKKKSARLNINGNLVDQSVFHTEPAFWEMFGFTFVQGSSEAAKEQSSVFISDKLAVFHFGTTEVLGEIITVKYGIGIELEADLEIAGVFKEKRENSSFQFDLIAHFDQVLKAEETAPSNWQSVCDGSFIRLPSKLDKESVEKLLNANYLSPLGQNDEEQRIEAYALYSVEQLRHSPRGAVKDSGLFRPMPAPAVIAPAIMAFFMLLLASFNFINTALAAAGTRLKEIGVRKVMGGNKRQIIFQFMGENLLLCFFGFAFGLLLAEVFVPAYNSLFSFLSLEVDYSENVGLFGFLTITLFCTALFAGAYPALYVSRFNPISIFGNSYSLNGSSLFMRVLLSLQFTIALIGLVGGAVFLQNARFQEEMDFGYYKDRNVIVPLYETNDYDRLKELAAGIPEIEGVYGSKLVIGKGYYMRNVSVEGIEMATELVDVGEGYIQGAGVTLALGETLTEADLEHKVEQVLVNQTFIKRFGIKEALGKELVLNDSISLHVKGVVEDYHTFGFGREVMPTVIRIVKPKDYIFFIAKATEGKAFEANKKMKEKWAGVSDNPYGGFLMEDHTNRFLDINRSLTSLFSYLGLLAIVLASFGLYSMVSLNIGKRMKELGIRKILGASALNIAGHLNKHFVIILFIAGLLGSLASYYVIKLLLNMIWTYHTPITPLPFFIAIAVLFVTAILTVGYKVYRAAHQNPVESLRVN